jgi:hypothetical protein
VKHSKNTKNTEKERAIKELNNIGSWISDKTKKKQVPKDEMMSLSISLMYLKEYLEKNEMLDDMIRYFEEQEGYDINEVIEDIVYETELLAINESPISMDECDIVWGEDDYICELDVFVRKYTDEILKKVVNVIKSYKEDDNMAIAEKTER